MCHHPGPMRTVLVTLFWCWFAFSVCVYAFRLYRRLTRGPRAAREAAAGPAVAARVRDPPPAPSPPAAPSGRAGLFAPAATAAGAAAPPPGRTPVASALAGISLPCELAPLTGAGELPDPHRVVFFTDRAPAETVGAALGDELERLGFTLRSVSDTEVVATRGGTELSVRVHPGTEGFPTAPPGSVVVVVSS